MITNSSLLGEIGSGGVRQSLEGKERSKGAVAVDHMVTGWPAASNVAAAVGGARWRDGTEREEEGEEVPEDGVLTQSVLGRPAGAGVAGRRRIGVRPRRPEAGKERTVRANGEIGRASCRERVYVLV